MAVKVCISPSTPGDFVRFSAVPEGVGIAEIARHLGVSRQSVYALFNNERRLTMQMAKKFELAFGVSAHMLLNHQARYEAWQADRQIEELAEGVTPFVHGGTPA